jgi:Family of unknown function (DUF6298)
METVFPDLAMQIRSETAIHSHGLSQIRLASSLVLLSAFLAVLLGCGEGSRGTPLPRPPSNRDSIQGPLAVLPGNPRYFTNQRSRKAIFLTGTHTWDNFQDWGITNPLRPLDYKAYLDLLERHGHNFIRLWVWEQAGWFPGTKDKVVIEPLPYLRTGQGRALDDGPKFDVTQFNPAYFHRLRDRVEAAGARGIYVSVMLFNGWSIELKGRKEGNPWRGHPFNRENNINGINGDVDGDGEGKEVHTLINPSVTALQKAYLRRVVESLRGLDNVLWEISNESHPGSVEWQYEMIRTIKKALESGQAKHHSVGMTAPWPDADGGNKVLVDSPADWIAPRMNKTDDYAKNPPASNNHKVVITDTDHIWGVGGNPSWVWKSFMRGLNPIFMDPYVTSIRRNLPAWPPPEVNRSTSGSAPAPEWENVRSAMGYARSLSDRVDLSSMQPMGQLASTGYCLAAPGKEYLAYLPFQGDRRRRLIGSIWKGLVAGNIELDLSASLGTFSVEWIDVERGLIIPRPPVSGGRRIELSAPFVGDAVLHLKKTGPGDGL